MFNQRPDHFKRRKEQNIQPILKKEKNRSSIQMEYKLNIVL